MINAKLLVYDLEICNAIPPKDERDRLPDIKYCGGWEDFENMGISAISWCILDAESLQTIESHVSACNHGAMSELGNLASNSIVKIGGFNSRKFNDRLLAANGLKIISDFDILDLILEAAGVHNTSYWTEGLRYNLAAIASANNLLKTGAGENAPILYQKGRITELLTYCLNDSIVETKILQLLIQGKLIDPNTGMVLDPGSASNHLM
jgi:hypothetical protein